MRKRVEAILASFLILLCIGLRFAYTGHGKNQEGGADLITIDALIPFGKLERPAVRFPHDKHAGGDGDVNCHVCHQAGPGESGILFAFKAQEGLSREEVKDLYHAECITCHADRATAKQTTGPQVCGGCHVNGSEEPVPSTHSIDFEANLHAAHTDSAGLDCQACHGALASDTLKEPGSTYDSRPGASSHNLCITCHLEEAPDSAPLNCSGCHQSYSPETIAHGGEVDFDHELHETADVSCGACHHKEPETSCAECHTDGDAKTGGGVTLQSAMHSQASDRSCVGCHEAAGVGELSDCTGCHAPFEAEKP